MGSHRVCGRLMWNRINKNQERWEWRRQSAEKNENRERICYISKGRWVSCDLEMSQAGLLCKCSLVPCFWARYSLPTITFCSSRHYYQTHKYMHDPSPISCSILFSWATKAFKDFMKLLGKYSASSRKPWDMPLSLKSYFPTNHQWSWATRTDNGRKTKPHFNLDFSLTYTLSGVS